MSKIEHLRFVIGRFDHYFEGINSKGAFYIGLNSFFAGGIVASYSLIKTSYECTTPINVLLGTIIFLAALSSLYTLCAINPFLTEGPNNSITYFRSIFRMGLPAFRQKIASTTEDTIIVDLEEQVHELATALNGKFEKMQTAGRMIIVEIILMLPLLYLLIQNPKP